MSMNEESLHFGEMAGILCAIQQCADIQLLGGRVGWSSDPRTPVVPSPIVQIAFDILTEPE